VLRRQQRRRKRLQPRPRDSGSSVPRGDRRGDGRGLRPSACAGSHAIISSARTCGGGLAALGGGSAGIGSAARGKAGVGGPINDARPPVRGGRRRRERALMQVAVDINQDVDIHRVGARRALAASVVRGGFCCACACAPLRGARATGAGRACASGCTVAAAACSATRSRSRCGSRARAQARQGAAWQRASMAITTARVRR
jgi:hypothetical protein